MTGPTKAEIRKIKQFCCDFPDEVIRELLDPGVFPKGLEARILYEREGDDDRGGFIGVGFTPDADGWVQVISTIGPEQYGTTHRFRTAFGGGHGHKVRAALLILALAIKLENDENPCFGREGPAPQE